MFFGACLDQAADLIDQDVQDHNCVGIWPGIAWVFSVVDEHANAVLCHVHLVLEKRAGVRLRGEELG